MKGVTVACLLFAIVLEGNANPCTIRNKHADCSFRKLHHVPVLPRNVVTIDLTGNYINTLKNGIFENYTNLKSLLLDKNNISKIQDQAFSGISKLRRLTLSRNKINVTDKNFNHPIFKFTPALMYLDLSKNVKGIKSENIVSLYPEHNLGLLTNLLELRIDLYPKPVFGPGFRRLINLKTIKFQYCFVQTLTNDTFQNIRNITCLSMRNCQSIVSSTDFRIPSMDNGVFQYFPFLRRLDLSNSFFTISRVMENLQSLQHREMEVLNLYNVNPARLMWLNKNYFVRLTQYMTRYYRNMCVNHINLGNNGIAQVDPGVLVNMTYPECLKSLILSENNFMIFLPQFFEMNIFFKKSVNLEAFDFSYMLIQMPSSIPFPYETFTDCTNKDVTEDENALQPSLFTPSISNRTLYMQCPPSLKVLRVSHVVIPYNINSNTVFRNCSKLEFLDLSSNPFTQFDFHFIGMENTKVVNLSGINLFKVEKKFINSFKKVKHLVLQNVNLDKAFVVGNYFLNELCELHILDLSLNHLLELHPNALCQNRYLYSLNLSSNLFDNFPTNLKKFENLSSIDLSFNHISQIDNSISNWLDEQLLKGRNVSLMMKGNVFVCGCNNEKFIKWVYETRIQLVDKENFICSLENGTRIKMKFVYQNIDQYLGNCLSAVLMEFGVAGLSVMGLALVACIVCYRFRWRILYFCYRQCRPAKPPNANIFDFDAFIAYTGEDHKWVFEKLRSKLEVEHNLKVCLHDREFVLGETIAQNIVDFIRRSRKIVFNLTPGYLTAKWCEFELEMARMEMFQRGTPDAVIVIIQGEVDPENMPRCIRDIWEHVTCVIFPEEEEVAEADNMFWTRLYDAIVN